MPTEGAPPAAPAAEAVAAPADPFDKVIATVEARKEAAAAEGKAGVSSAGTRSDPASSNAPGASGAPSTDGVRPKPRAADLGALAQREWQARQREERAKATEARYAPLDASLSKKDLRTALTVMAEQHGVTFNDFVQVLTEAAPAEKTPAEVAAETVAAKLAERDTADAKARDEAIKRQRDAQEAQMRTNLQAQAEAGDGTNADRWELTAIAGTGGQAWDVIWGHYQATAQFGPDGRVIVEGEKLTKEQALDLIEKKLKEKREARRPKQGAANGSAAVNGHNEAAGQRADGRAAAPSFTNRATSGMPAAVGAHAVDEAGLPEHEAIARAAARVGIRL